LYSSFSDVPFAAADLAVTMYSLIIFLFLGYWSSNDPVEHDEVRGLVAFCNRVCFRLPRDVTGVQHLQFHLQVSLDCSYQFVSPPPSARLAVFSSKFGCIGLLIVAFFFFLFFLGVLIQ